MEERMNKKKSFLASVMALMFVLMLVAPAMAAERIVNLEITEKVTTNDRNGNEYTRLIVTEIKQLQGVSYPLGVAAMAFGAMNETAKTLEIGDTLRAIVSDRTFNGTSSLTIRKFLE
jgi:hypothetical protein